MNKIGEVKKILAKYKKYPIDQYDQDEETQEICQQFPKSPNNPEGYEPERIPGENAELICDNCHFFVSQCICKPKPNDRLLTEAQTEIAVSGIPACGKDPSLNLLHHRHANEIRAIKDAENKELGLLLESKIGGEDEFNDWSEKGLRYFRVRVLAIIREHCQKLKAGDLGILHKYLDEKEAECQQKLERIFGDLDSYLVAHPRSGSTSIYGSNYNSVKDKYLKKQEGVKDGK